MPTIMTVHMTNISQKSRARRGATAGKTSPPIAMPSMSAAMTTRQAQANAFMPARSGARICCLRFATRSGFVVRLPSQSWKVRIDPMTLYVFRRLGLAVLIVCLSMLFLLSAIHLVPGDPAGIALGPRASPEMREAFRIRMGLDQPFVVQYFKFLFNAMTGDLGVDVWSNRPVAAIIGEQLPHTLALTFLGLGWAIVVGIPLGCLSAIRPGSLLDRITGIVSVSAIAVPSFIIALYSLLIFAVYLRWLPAIGAGDSSDRLDQLAHLILPSFAIGLGWVGYLARMVRASMLEVMGENHIRMARAYGLPTRRIIYVYALKLAILPTVALLGVGVGALLSGAVFAEIVFARPGIGKLVYDGVITRNYPIVMGGVMVTTALYALCTLVSDMITAMLDPRVRQSL